MQMLFTRKRTQFQVSSKYSGPNEVKKKVEGEDSYAAHRYIYILHDCNLHGQK